MDVIEAVQPEAGSPSMAAVFENDAAVAFGKLLAEKRAKGQPYATIDGAGRVVYVHPDGVVRMGRHKTGKVVD